jgi:voltage-gated potassium channel
VAAFTLINATLTMIGIYEPRFQAFSWQGGEQWEGMIDSLYLTIVLMTTLGFGDIYPVSQVAKLLVSLQCLTSYLVFALMIGILTRGIASRREEGEKDDPEADAGD